MSDVPGLLANLDRRKILNGVGALAAISLGGTKLTAASTRPFFERVKLPIGLQLYILGNGIGRDLDAAFASIAQIGYREVELPNLFGRKPAEIGAAAARAGLSIAGLHLPLAPSGKTGLTLGSEASRITDALGELKANWVVAPIAVLPTTMRPSPGESMPAAIGRAFAAAGADIWKKTASMLNEQAQALKPMGVGVAYHNHNIEFAPIGTSNGWAILTAETDPSLVFFEVDVGWVAAAGLDPVAFIDRLRGRVRLLHVKDIGQGTPINYAIDMKSTEVGAGIQPWRRLLEAAFRAGAHHFLVEQEPPFTIPRIEAARRSYVFLSRISA